MKKKKNSNLTVNEKINRQNISKSFFIIYLCDLVLVIAFGLIAYFVFKETVFDILKDTVGNLVGVLAAFLLFDIINDKLQKESAAEEMTNNILKAIMAKPETMNSFTQDQRNSFILSTVKSSVSDDDVAEMVSSQCLKYLSSNQYDKIKLKFDYKFEIRDQLPEVFSSHFKTPSHYYYVQEVLGYSVRCFSKSNIYENTVYIGLMFNNNALDKAFREDKSDLFQHCIFRENLDIEQCDIEYLKGLDSENLRTVIEQLFKFDIQIDQSAAILKNVEILSIGILLQYCIKGNSSNEHTVRIIFHMPKLYGSILQIVLSDPTKAPSITVSYPEDSMRVEMCSFLSKGKETSYEIAHEEANGIYDISIPSEWIYPISGLIFTITKK